MEPEDTDKHRRFEVYMERLARSQKKPSEDEITLKIDRKTAATLREALQAWGETNAAKEADPTLPNDETTRLGSVLNALSEELDPDSDGRSS